MSPAGWLPAIIPFSENWYKYLLFIYSKYEADFVQTTPRFKGINIGVKREPRTQGMDWAFWHIIQTGKNEESRIPDLRRCERISWPRPIIENCEEGCIKIWENIRDGKPRICIWYEEIRYIVILIKKKAGACFLTGYPIDRPHTERKIKQEYEKNKARIALSSGPGTPSTRGR